MLKYLSLFSGIGAFEKALDRMNIKYELVGYSEIDKYASKSYSRIHNVSEDKNLGDITKHQDWDLPSDIDLVTYGFPCQDISVAGKCKGFTNEDGSSTRSGLFFEALDIIEKYQPKFAVAENVKNLVGKKFANEFRLVIDSLDKANYNSYYKVLNAKDFGIPQNRERVFIISVRKDIDKGLFAFPEPFPLKLRLKDMLEDRVDEKYYLNDEQVARIKTETFNNANYQARVSNENGIMKTLLARDYKDPKCVELEDKPIRLGNVYGENYGTGYAGNVWDKNGISPSLMTMQGGGRQPMVTDDSRGISYDHIVQYLGYEQDEDDSIYCAEPKIQRLGSYTPSNYGGSNCGVDASRNGVKIIEPMALDEQNSYIRSDGCVGTLMANGSSPKHNNRVLEPINVEKIGNIYKSQGENGNIYSTDGISPTLKAGNGVKGNGIGSCNSPKCLINSFRVRKLTPKECFRLMGFDDSDFNKAQEVNSNTQLYKQAGNSIVVDVLENIIYSLSAVYDEFRGENQ